MSQSNLYPSLPGDDLRSQTQVDSPRVLVHEYNGNFNQAEERKTSDSTNINSSLITTAVATTTTTTTIAAAAATTTTATAIAAPSATASRAVTTTTTTLNPTMTLSTNPPIPLSTYISLSQVAISSALKVAMVSTSMSLGVARTIVSGLDTVLGYAVKGVVGQNDEGSRGLSPAFIASLPFRAALLGINFSDILVQTILETVDGSVNLALTTVQDGLDLMDTLFGPDSTSQTGETFREVWAILNREFIQSGDGEGGAGGYPALEGMRLLMAYVAIQFATSEQWETIRVRTQGRLIGECLESKDEELGSSTAWSALAAWPEEWTKGHRGLTTEERLQEERILELREQREGRTAASFSAYAPGTPSMRSGSPNPELTNFLAASYRFSRFCSAMYGSTALEFMGAPERYPPPPIPVSTAPSAPPAPASLHTTPSASPLATELPRTTSTSDHHFHCYTGTPLGSILYSSDTAATIQDGYYSPRYYLLDDVESKQIVLVLRGTKSLHDLMIDLTCDAADLWLDHDTTPLVDSQGNIVDREAQQQRRKRPFKVHGGFLKAARTIASADTIGIQEKVKAALESRPDYSLLLVGHSLGAGIASILSMLWADPATGFTPEVPSHSSATATTAPHVGLGLASGLGLGVEVDDARGRLYLPGYLPQNNAESFLPPGRRVRCYAYGIPKVMCPRMSKRAIKLVTSLSYGDDVVGRLSLGSVRNIGHAMRALLAMRPPPPPSPPATPSPPSSPRMGATSTEIESDNASIRSIKSTVRSGLYSTSPSSSPSSPPRASHTTGGHLHPPLQRQHSSDSVRTFQTTTTTSPGSLHPDSQNTDKLLYRMYAVPEPEHVFDEMLFSRRMWSDHLPLTYEFILAGKHAIPVTSPEAQKEKEEIVAASARGSVAV
ncbi:hypothetical protein BC939DRAFT_109961 [Gamsiella multidivaricata]|uniref:uncharacterized protein n=1 Tax=Gamsiella multidivaricata TaxID=101098 RepID=UPI00221E6DA0|nr:uncharacterized protein BC939DRAFT_109961 [Gamsiella multidivaricata]KAI7826983.1 hypothetical protein BC939DRAFT_109961 [Gamsiella multidivaricata]